MTPVSRVTVGNPQRLLAVLALGVALLVLLTRPSLAAGQTAIRDTGFRRETVVDESLLRAGRWETSIGLSGGWAYSSVLEDGSETVQNSVYVTPALVVGRMFTDELEGRIALGLLYLRTGVGTDVVSQDQLSGQGALQGVYHVPMVLGLALFVGAGVGGYLGYQDRPSGVSRARFTTGGFLGQVMVGLLAQPGASVFVRGGLRSDFLVGTESPEDPTLGDGSTAVNVLLNADLSIGLRFG